MVIYLPVMFEHCTLVHIILVAIIARIWKNSRSLGHLNQPATGEKEVVGTAPGRRRLSSSLPAGTCSFTFEEKKKKGILVVLNCFERLDLTFALIRHLILCLIVSCKPPSWSGVVVGSVTWSTLGNWKWNEQQSVRSRFCYIWGLECPTEEEGSREGSGGFCVNIKWCRALPLPGRDLYPVVLKSLWVLRNGSSPDELMC